VRARDTARSGERRVEHVAGGVDIEALEVYRGIYTPPEFMYTGFAPCGAIVVWSRR
jgi:hypothetical protein